MKSDEIQLPGQIGERGKNRERKQRHRARPSDRGFYLSADHGVRPKLQHPSTVDHVPFAIVNTFVSRGAAYIWHGYDDLDM